MAAYEIRNAKTDESFGFYEGGTAIAALVTMWRDAGYDVWIVDGSPAFGGAEAERLCGDVSDWNVEVA